MKALEKDRTRRYETANALSADIQRHLHRRAGHRPPGLDGLPPSESVSTKQTGLHRGRGGRGGPHRRSDREHLAGGRSQPRPGTPKRSSASPPRPNATQGGGAQEAEAISTFLTDVLQSPDPARNGATLTVAEMLGMAAKKLDTDLASQPARRAKLQATLGRTYFALGIDP